MPSQMIQGEMHIGRTSHGMIHIEIKDETSGVKFLNMEIALEQFAMLITGAVQSHLPMAVKGLGIVGKQKIREVRQIVCPLDSYHKPKLEAWLIENAQEDGWILNHQLGSQSSVKSVGNESILSYSVHKYVDTI